MIGTAWDKERTRGAEVGGAGRCAVVPRRGTWRTHIAVGGAVTLLAGGAYTGGWIGETGLMVALIAYVGYLRAMVGGFG